MSNLLSQIVPSLQILKILGNTDSFRQWLQKIHPNKDNNALLDGYKFSLNCCLNAFIDGIADDRLLDIRNDLLLDRAISELIHIHKIENTCEKTIFLKNLKPYVKAVIKSTSYEELDSHLKEFNADISSKFDIILNDYISMSRDINIDRELMIKMWLINFTHTYLIQINNSGPVANFYNPLAVELTKTERLEYYFEGYKYAIQFLWYILLGEDKFESTHLKVLHLADSWKNYKYSKEESDSSFDIFNQEFILEEQTCLDSYFHWIKRDITTPLEDQYKIVVHEIDSYFQFIPNNYKKERLFANLLNKTNIEQNTPKLSFSDKIDERLYWFPFQIVKSEESQMHYGIPSFNTMLAGTVALHNSTESHFSKIIVAKFTHPLPAKNNENDYSYGILVDAKSAAGHYYSGWVIYQNACGDYSGFSGNEHNFSEELIRRYSDDNKIELRELNIPLKDFKEFTNQYTLKKAQLSILEENKLIPIILQKSKAYLFELFVYHRCVESYNNKYKIQINRDKKSPEGEKDIVIQNDDEVILIECKLNPQSYNMYELIEKLEKKIKGFPQNRKSCQLWFWNELGEKNRDILDHALIAGKSVKIVIVSNPRGESTLNGVDLNLLKYIMQDY